MILLVTWQLIALSIACAPEMAVGVHLKMQASRLGLDPADEAALVSLAADAMERAKGMRNSPRFPLERKSMTDGGSLFVGHEAALPLTPDRIEQIVTFKRQSLESRGQTPREIDDTITILRRNLTTKAADRARSIRDAYRTLGIKDGTPEDFQAAVNQTLKDLHTRLGDRDQFEQFTRTFLHDALTETLANPKLAQQYLQNKQIPRGALYRVILHRAKELGFGDKIKIIRDDNDYKDFTDALGSGRLFFDRGAVLIDSTHGSETHLFQLLFVGEVMGQNLGRYGGAPTMMRYFASNRSAVDDWVNLFDRPGRTLHDVQGISHLLNEYLGMNPGITTRMGGR